MPAKPLAVSINCFRRGGGMESYTFDLVRHLTGDGRSVRVYAAQFDSSLPEYTRIEPCLIKQRLVPKKLRPFFFSAQLQPHRRTGEQLIACNPSDHAAVFVCGGTHLGYLRGMGKTATPLDKLTVCRNRSNYATARSIMAHSALMQRELAELYDIDPVKIRVVYPPADPRRFRPDAESAAVMRRRCGFRDDETVFLFPSTGHTRKGLDLLAAFFEHTDLPVKLAVAGSPLPRPMKNVVGLGFCDDMPALYRAADYTIMASLYEPFGLVGIESVLSGTRVVLSDNMACTEVMNSGAGFFFSRTKPEDLAEAVRQAVALKQSGAHKITEPLQALAYNPDVAHHITELQAMLQAV